MIMTIVHSPDYSLVHDVWLRSVIYQRHRPNILVESSGMSVAAAAAEIVRLSTHPLRVCLVPGDLHLPAEGGGTLLVGDVATLTVQQQIAIFDWMDSLVERVQVISITSVPVLRLVEEGHFLEGLFYRLNVVRVTMTIPSVAAKKVESP